MLFSWYFKGFKLLRRYLVKHLTKVDLENLNLEEVDKEMAIDEAAQSLVPKGGAPKMLLLMTPLLVTTLLLMLEFIT